MGWESGRHYQYALGIKAAPKRVLGPEMCVSLVLYGFMCVMSCRVLG